jgi:hypothetical protein
MLHFLKQLLMFRVGQKTTRGVARSIGLGRIATIAGLIERPEPIPRGEVGRCLALLAETAAPDRPRQSEILQLWAALLNTSQIANER